MIRPFLAILVSTTVFLTHVDAFSPAYSWPSGLLSARLMQYDQVMAEICIENDSDFRTPGTSFQIGYGGTTGGNLSKEEAQALALALCEGALVGLVRGLQVANQYYGPLSNIPDRLRVSRIVSYNGDDLRRAFIFGYEEDDVEEPTIQVLLRGLQRMHEL